MTQQTQSQARMRKAAEQLLAFLREDMKGTIAAEVPLWLQDCDVEENSITISLELLPWMAGPEGGLGSGVLSVLLDEAMGTISCMSAGGKMTPTVTMEMTFLKPVPAEGTILVKAWVSGHGDTPNITAAQLGRAEDPKRLLVTATGVYFVGASAVLLRHQESSQNS